MSRSSQESACQRLEQLRNRLETVREAWKTPPAETAVGAVASFQKDWQARWLRIVAYLWELDQMLNRSAQMRSWDPARPAVLQFAPAEEGALSPVSVG